MSLLPFRRNHSWHFFLLTKVFVIDFPLVMCKAFVKQEKSIWVINGRQVLVLEKEGPGSKAPSQASSVSSLQNHHSPVTALWIFLLSLCVDHSRGNKDQQELVVMSPGTLRKQASLTAPPPASSSCFSKPTDLPNHPQPQRGRERKRSSNRRGGRRVG